MDHLLKISWHNIYFSGCPTYLTVVLNFDLNLPPAQPCCATVAGKPPSPPPYLLQCGTWWCLSPPPPPTTVWLTGKVPTTWWTSPPATTTCHPGTRRGCWRLYSRLGNVVLSPLLTYRHQVQAGEVGEAGNIVIRVLLAHFPPKLVGSKGSQRLQIWERLFIESSPH